MTANIPIELLHKYSGYGFYSYSNKLFSEEKIPIPEYAISIEEFKKYNKVIQRCNLYAY